MRISDWSSDVCSSDLLEAPAAFRVFRDNHVSSKDALNARRPHMEALFAKLGKAGIARDSLYLAWDFTVASERTISERALHILDEAFAKLGAAAPTYTIDTVTDHTDPKSTRLQSRH